jgi:membrane protein YqaA with SNARE-associated domain
MFIATIIVRGYCCNERPKYYFFPYNLHRCYFLYAHTLSMLFQMNSDLYTLEFKLSGHQDAIFCMAISNAGNLLASGGEYDISDEYDSLTRHRN